MTAHVLFGQEGIMADKATRALLLASATPVIASVLLVLTIGPALPAPAAWVVLVAWPAGVVAALPPLGERWLPVLLWGARRATPSEQFTMAGPMGRVATQDGLDVQAARVRVVPGGDVHGYGARTVLLGQDVIAQLRHTRLSGEQAAARVAHQVGMLQTGATRWEPVVQVMALPWHTMATVRLPVITPLLRAGWHLRGLYVPVLAYLTWTERDPFHALAMLLLVLTYLLPRWHRSALAARQRVADDAIAGTSLARPFVDWLLQVDRSPAMYERVWALVTTGDPARQSSASLPARQPWW